MIIRSSTKQTVVLVADDSEPVDSGDVESGSGGNPTDDDATPTTPSNP